MDKFGDFGLLMTKADSEEETENDEKGDDDKEDEIGKGLEAEPVGKSGEGVRKNGDDDEDYGKKKPDNGTFDGHGIFLEGENDDCK